MAHTKGSAVRALLLVRTSHPPVEAAQLLVPLVAERQWTAEWSIKRIDIIDIEESRKLGKKEPFSLCVAVSARDRDTLKKAFNRIVDLLGTEDEPQALFASFGADWTIT
jgi:hypothetical protein